MLYNKWKPLYQKILKDFNFDNKKDIESAIILDGIINNNKTELIEKLIYNSEIVVFGAGPSLEKAIQKHKGFIQNKVKISADGATSALLKYDILPDIIVTDLDGKISDIIKANSKGSIVVVHAHGDNIEKLKQNVKKFNEKTIGTTQSDPSSLKNVYNFGGFTDGDRAVFLALYFNAKSICLIGFDFKGIIGKYSFPEKKNKELKLKKLKWCKYLLDSLINEHKNIHYL